VFYLSVHFFVFFFRTRRLWELPLFGVASCFSSFAARPNATIPLRGFHQPPPYPSIMQKKLTLTDAQIEDMREAFMAFDQDGNGTITPLELQNLMESLLGDATLNEEINTIIRSVDADGSGTIEFDEFVAFMSDPRFKDPTKDEHRQVFEMFDKDGSGRIDIAELKEAFKNIGQRLDDHEFEQILKEADLNGDSLIDYDEFLLMLKRQ